MKKVADTNSISPTDSELFRNTVGAVTPLAPSNRIIPPRPTLTFRSENTSTATLRNPWSDHITTEVAEEYRVNGLSAKVFRKLRRGEWPIADRLDLHGLNTDTARALLQQFLLHAQQQQARCVLIIHGKGLNSQGSKAVLRELSRHWLTQHPQVLAYCPAPAALGGSGALLALLKTLSE